jgi:hypothetical protein
MQYRIIALDLAFALQNIAWNATFPKSPYNAVFDYYFQRQIHGHANTGIYHNYVFYELLMIFHISHI